MNENGGKSSTILLTVIGIATLLVVVTGATFAYFAAIVKGDDNATSVYIKATSDGGTIEVSGGSEINLAGIYPKSDAWATQKFTVKYPEASGAADEAMQTTGIKLVVTKNTFKAGYIQVSLAGNNASAKGYTEDANSKITDLTNLPVVSDTATASEIQLVTGKRKRNTACTVEYTLSIFFKEKDENQNDGKDHALKMYMQDTTEA